MAKYKILSAEDWGKERWLAFAHAERGIGVVRGLLLEIVSVFGLALFFLCGAGATEVSPGVWLGSIHDAHNLDELVWFPFVFYIWFWIWFCVRSYVKKPD